MLSVCLCCQKYEKRLKFSFLQSLFDLFYSLIESMLS